ncbi:S41 family peptidase [Streptomyces clavuligerus]|uniref:Putative carboxy-terminal processing protease n=2 Tax=Streptomyces clavuligerus TaxID=1901 RepID=B5GSI4_STRCL|nr:S41 family peptidase [Streptomyces clavuligerus]ANW19965.1 peptidase S41 [Streptomyces clavuligerus]AXU14591.1 PDZ domain-containing protein [Streptomyces clavuligerus]EDY49280.1 carboxy-terminal processing protease [Streptomyces clavuligerus]EFG07149.1 Putative carboxy-terminal processing protease [Streptomyces clavuligerus]MBY6304603.1 PDZ domain-containing protein [Streptomyces clavuligerus]
MPGPDSHRPRPSGARRGAVLTLVFAMALAVGAAADALPRETGPRTPAVHPAGTTVDRDTVARAAAEAAAGGRSGTEAAQEAVRRGGDRWGVVYGEREYERFRRALDGEYTGVGLWPRRSRAGGIEVVRVQPGGPADRAGVRAGDRLRAVGGTAVDRCTAAEVVALLRGEARTRVELALERAGRALTRSLTRTTLSAETVTVRRLDPGAVMIKVAAFTTGTGQRVREAVRRAPEGAGVLLDLRGNSGGLVHEAVAAASAFLDGGLVATYDVQGEERSLYARPGGDTERPVVALVDGGTMSAAELVTGALQDRGRAVTVGSRTFGKGAVQMPSELPDGSVAELTVGHYRTPAGRSVDGTGITPDLPAGDAAEDRARTVLDGLGRTR